jgi:hypothetical protein
MDYYQGVVSDYIAADRATFVSNEFWINPKGGPEWFIDALAISLSGPAGQGQGRVYLCEVTYSADVAKIVKKVKALSDNLDLIKSFLLEVSNIPEEWDVKVWLFVLRDNAAKIRERLGPAYKPKITHLEDVAPWRYSKGYRERDPDQNRRV